MLDATRFVKAAAADELAFFGFGEEHVLRELVGFEFEDALGGCCVVLCRCAVLRRGLRLDVVLRRGLRECAELQAGRAQRMVENVRDGVAQCFQEFGIVHFCGRELDDGLCADPVKCACRDGCSEERFHIDDFDAAVFKLFAGLLADVLSVEENVCP